MTSIDLLAFEDTDLGNAERLLGWTGGRLRYCAETGRWLIRTGERLREGPARAGDVQRIARDMVREFQRQCREQGRVDGWAVRSESARAIAAMLAIARCLKGGYVSRGQGACAGAA